MPKKKGDKNMKLVLAEKPSVAQSIAKALGCLLYTSDAADE